MKELKAPPKNEAAGITSVKHPAVGNSESYGTGDVNMLIPNSSRLHEYLSSPLPFKLFHLFHYQWIFHIPPSDLSGRETLIKFKMDTIVGFFYTTIISGSNISYFAEPPSLPHLRTSKRYGFGYQGYTNKALPPCFSKYFRRLTSRGRTNDGTSNLKFPNSNGITAVSYNYC
jgi:hypothetical protein